MIDPIREQMDNIQRDASKVYRVDNPYKDFRAPQYPEAVPLPDDKQLSELTSEEIKARFPQIYQKPEAASAERIPPAFAPMAKEETILGIPIGKRPSAGVTEMEPMLEFDIFGKAIDKENRMTVALAGAGQVVNRTYTPGVDYDPRLVDPNVSLRDIIDFSKEGARNAFTTHTFFHDKDGRAYKVTPENYPSLDALIDYADTVGAVAYTNKDGKKRNFPWIKELTRQMKLPADVSTDVVDPETGRVMSTSDIVTMRQLELAMHANGILSYNLAGTELGGALYARYLNEVLIERGVTDERTRAILIKSQTSAPTMGDLQKIAGNVSDNAIRPFFEVGLLGFGEAADIADSIIQMIPFNDRFAGIDDMRPLKELGLPVDYERRQEIMRKVYEDFPSALQRYYISIGANISLPQAQILASRYSGMLPRGIQLFAEIRSGSGIVNLSRKFSSVKEMRNFQKWSENKLETDPKNYNSETTFDKLLEGYTEETSRILRSEKSIKDRIRDYYQVEDASLPKDQQVLYTEANSALTLATQRKNDLLANIRKRGQPMTDQERLRIDALNQNISLQTSRLRSIKLSRSVPQFVKDSNVQDRYLVAGSATIGHYLPEFYNVDPEMGELVGLLAGAAVSLSEGKFRLYQNFTSGGFGGKGARLNYLVSNLMDGGNTSFNEGLLGRAEVIGKYEDELISMGVTPDLASVSATTILDLAALKYFEETTKEAVAIGKLLDSEAQDALSRNLNKQKQLVGELREILMNNKAISPKSDFFKMVDTGIKSFEANADRLEKLVGTIVGNDVSYFSAVARQNGGLAVTQKPDKTVAAAIETLSNDKLLDPDAKPGDIARSAANIRKTTAQDAAVGAQKIVQTIITDPNFVGPAQLFDEAGVAIPAQSAAAALVRDEPLTVKRADPTTGDDIEYQLDPVDINSPGHLMAYQLLGKHAVDKSIASRPFIALEEATNARAFIDVNGDNVTGTPTVEISDIFAGLLTPDVAKEELAGLALLQKKSLKPSERAGLLATVNELTDPFFDSAAIDGKTTKAKTIDGMVKAIQEQDPTFRVTSNKISDKQFDVARWISTNKNVSLMRMNMSQLLEFDRTLTGLSYSAADPKIRAKYKSAQASTMEAFDNMEINGQRIDEMQVEFEGQVRNVVDVLRIGKARWSDFKNRWYDTSERGKEVARLLSWGNQKSVNVSTRDPFGIEFSVNPSEWISVPKLLKMNDDELDTYFSSFAEVLGTERRQTQPSGATVRNFVFTATDPETESFRQIMQAEIALHVHRNYKDIDPNEFMDGIRRLEKRFTMENPDGSQVSMFSFADTVDDHLSYDTLDAAVKKDADAKATTAIKEATAKFVQPAQDQIRATKEAVKFLQGFKPEVKGVNDLGKSFAELGSVGYRNLVENVSKSTGLDESAVRNALREVYIRDMVMASYEQTNRTMRKADGEIADQSVHNSDVVRRYLGTGDPEQAKFIREEILDFDIAETGVSHYDNNNNIARFLAELDADPLVKKINIKGIPRAMSVESYISRFYAINRGVVRPQYVGTEAVLQQMRFSKFSFLKAVVSDPDLGILFMEMVRTGRPLDPRRNAQFEALLIQAIGEDNALYGTEPAVTTTKDGQRIDVYADQGYYSDDPKIIKSLGADKVRLPEARQIEAGERRAAKGFPEMRGAAAELRELGVEPSVFSTIDQ
tara:strand:+ start:102 stop:5129 length:5028 start_codon:yes stop_codon:yes gene_type:complete